MIHISLFSGIGGFDLAAEWAGWTNAMSCEINPFGRKVLEYYWPNSYHHDDIHTLNEDKINEELEKRFGTHWRANGIVLSGGFPCQPYSLAGQRKGKDDSRHLWPQMLRVIQIIRPNYIVGENVLGIVSWNGGLVFEEVCAELEAEGYEVQPFVLPACSVDAPHRRDRVWFVAHSNNSRGSAGLGQVQGENGKVPQRHDNAELSDAGNRNVAHSNGSGSEKPIVQHSGLLTGSTWHNKQVTANANIDRYTSSTEGTETQGVGGGNNGQQEVGREQAERIDGFFGFQRFVADSTSDRREWERQESEIEKGLQSKPKPTWELEGGFERLCDNGYAANSSNEGLQRSKEHRVAGSIGQESYQQSTRCVRSDWEKFPTQSPVCSRDDGFSARLDNITFSRWRSESIKAYGNAVVPQVVYQIFKTINECSIHFDR